MLSYQQRSNTPPPPSPLPPGCAPPGACRCASCNWTGWVPGQRVQRHCRVWRLGRLRDSRIAVPPGPGPLAMERGLPCERVSHPGTGSRRRGQGIKGLARRARARRRRGSSSNLGCQRSANGKLRPTSSCVPILTCPARLYTSVRDHRPRGRNLQGEHVSAGPRPLAEVPADQSLEQLGERSEGRGRAQGCGGAPAPSPENIVAPRRVDWEGLRRVVLSGPGMVSGTGGEVLIPIQHRPVSMGSNR